MLTKTRQEDPQLPDWKFEQRLGAVTRTDRFEFLMSRARNKKVLHIGCADGHLHRFLGSVASELWGVDLSEERIADMRRVGYRNIYQGDAEQLQRIPELRGQHFDAIIAGEMIEHLNNPGLFLDGCRFLSSANTEVIITTPNIEYNPRFETLPAGQLRHRDHRFEWTRAEFEGWAAAVCDRHGYAVEFAGVGEPDPQRGSPTQMAVFRR